MFQAASMVVKRIPPRGRAGAREGRFSPPAAGRYNGWLAYTHGP